MSIGCLSLWLSVVVSVVVSVLYCLGMIILGMSCLDCLGMIILGMSIGCLSLWSMVVCSCLGSCLGTLCTHNTSLAVARHFRLAHSFLLLLCCRAGLVLYEAKLRPFISQS